MNGMHQEQRDYYNTGDDDYSTSNQFELPPTPTLAQISLGDFYEFDDQSHVDLGFTSCTYLDSEGVTRTDPFPDIDSMDAVRVFGRNGLASATFEIRISNIAASFLVNFFYWDQVN